MNLLKNLGWTLVFFFSSLVCEEAFGNGLGISFAIALSIFGGILLPQITRSRNDIHEQ